MTADTIDNFRQASRYLLGAARAWHLAERIRCRPSIVLAAELSEYTCAVTGKSYFTASYGSLVATGDTPEEAFTAFDAAWNEGLS